MFLNVDEDGTGVETDPAGQRFSSGSRILHWFVGPKFPFADVCALRLEYQKNCMKVSLGAVTLEFKQLRICISNVQLAVFPHKYCSMYFTFVL